MSSPLFVQDTGSAVDGMPADAPSMRRHRTAISRIDKALEKEHPVVLMTGPDSFELGRIITEFSAGLDDRTTIVRLRQPQDDALTAFGAINRAIGFDPKDLTLSELQNVLPQFLEHQRKHHHRTVLCVERVDHQSKWLVDSIAQLIQSTEESKIGSGLFVILSGGDQMTAVLQEPKFDIIRRKAGSPIRMAPLSIFETGEFLRHLSSSQGHTDFQSMFDVDAIGRLHGLSGGSPHLVSSLYRESVAIAEKQGSGLATSKVVVAAARRLRAGSGARPAVSRPSLAEVPRSADTARRLLIRCPRRAPREHSLRPGRYMVGRAETADICLTSLSVSRRHALIIVTEESTQVLDLGSANGTFAGPERISEATLSPGDVLTLGDCEIEYSV